MRSFARSRSERAPSTRRSSTRTRRSSGDARRPRRTRRSTLALERVSTSRLPEFDDSAGAAPLQDTRNEAGPEDASAPPPERIRELTERAIDLVRDLPAVTGLRKGGHLAHAVRDASFGWVARSFASIYVLIVVFESPFDELRAEQAIEDGLPRIERLVLALPPLDPKPSPIASVISMRGRARRR